MLVTSLVVAALVVGWFVTRWAGKGKPCPTSVAALFDNPVVGRLSGVNAVLDRADVRQGMRVLDAGCGPGRLTIPLARRVGRDGEVVALDLQQAMLDRVARNIARAGVGNVRLVRGSLDADSPVLRNEPAFDRILLVTVLGEIPDQAGALRSLHSVLAPGGLLSVTETIIDPDYLPRGRVKDLASSAGFTLAQDFGSALAFTLNFRKVS